MVSYGDGNTRWDFRWIGYRCLGTSLRLIRSSAVDYAEGVSHLAPYRHSRDGVRPGRGCLPRRLGMVAQVTPYNENPITAVFDLTGVEEVVAQILEACEG